MITFSATIRWMLVSHPCPRKKIHPPDFCHYAIIPFYACTIHDPAPKGVGSEVKTRVRTAFFTQRAFVGVSCTV